MTTNDVEIRIKGSGNLDQAKAQVAALKERVRELSREKIRIDAETDQARRKIADLKAELKAGTSGRPTVEIDADITAARAKIDELQRKAREIGRERASLQLDTGEAQTKIAAVKAEADRLAGQTATVEVDADTGGAQAKLLEVAAEIRGVSGEVAHVAVDADVGAALAKIALVGAALAGLGVAGGAVGAALGLGAVAGAGIGAAVAGLSGIGGAVKALGESTKSAGSAASGAAGHELQLASAVDRVKQANASLVNTRAQVADTEHRAAEAAQRAAAAEKRAIADVTAAQRDLTAARQDAARMLRDLARQSEDMALAQQGALLDVEQAKQSLDETLADPKATDLQRRQAQLAYDEAIQHNKDLGDQAADLASKKADADRRGVAGSEQVTSATKALTDAQRSAAEAHEATADAQRASLASQRDGAFRLAQAQQAVVDAQRAVQQASVSAGSAGAAATNKLNDAMKGLSPTAQNFARFLRGFIDGPIAQLRTAAQAGLLPGLQKGLESLVPIISANLPAFKAFSTVVGQALGGVITVAGQLAPPLMRMATVVLAALAPMQGVLTQFAVAFGKVVDQVSGDGSMQAAIGEFVKLFAALLLALPPLIPPFVKLAVAVLPVLTGAVKLLTEGLTLLLGYLGDHAQQAISGTVEGFKLLWAWAQVHLVPALRDLGKWIIEYVWPALVKFGEILGGGVLTAVRMVAGAVSDHRQELMALGRAFATVATFIITRVVPIIGTVLKVQLIVIAGIFAAVITVIAGLVRAFGTAVRWAGNVAGAFHTVGRAASDAGNVIRAGWNSVVGFVAGLPGRIASAASGMWDGIKQAFRNAINWVIGAWNGLHIPGFGVDFDKGPIHLHEHTPEIRVPQIPYLVSGGISSGFAVVGEAGRELVRLPTGSSVRSAPDTASDLAGAGGGRLVVEWTGAPTGGLERAVFEWLRETIRFKTGGSVQGALGS